MESPRPPGTSPARVHAAPMTPLGPKRAHSVQAGPQGRAEKFEESLKTGKESFCDSLGKHWGKTIRPFFKDLRKEVETGANGTQDYVVKKGINKDTIATTRQ